MKKRNTRRCSAEQATNTNLLKDLLSSVISFYGLGHDSCHRVAVTNAGCFRRDNPRSRARIDKQCDKEQDEEFNPPHRLGLRWL